MKNLLILMNLKLKMHHKIPKTPITTLATSPPLEISTHLTPLKLNHKNEMLYLIAVVVVKLKMKSRNLMEKKKSLISSMMVMKDRPLKMLEFNLKCLIWMI